MSATSALQHNEATAETAGRQSLPIGVVIPAYGHPRFLGEAIISACTQETERDIRVVVIDDGCRFEETANIVHNLAEEYPGKLFYLRQKNTRLPGARNKGVRFLLQAFPEMEAIFFLDADNRLSPYSIDAYRLALGDDETIGWAYPDISFFGLSWGRGGFDTRETAPDYSVLKHLAGNISEAGSLVRASMFHHGVFYDETMRSGFEDWDFWLGALGAGYRGVRVKDAGFLYRRRAESMLADSRREEELLIARMKAKHKALFEPAHLMQVLHDEAPTFAVINENGDRVRLFADPDSGHHEMTGAAFADLLARVKASPKEYFFPLKVMVCPDVVWQMLMGRCRPYLRWLFWHLLRRPADALAISFHAGAGVEWLGTSARDTAHMLAFDAAYFERVMWDESPLVQLTPGTFQHAVISCPLEACPAVRAIIDIIAGLGPMYSRLPRGAKYLRHTDRRYAGPNARALYKNIVVPACSADEDYFPPVPWVRKPSEKWCAFVIMEADTPRERLVGRMTQMREKGYRVLVIIEREEGIGPSGNTADITNVADMIVPIEFERSEGTSRFYLGRSVYSVMTVLRQLEVETLAVHFDMLIADYGSTCLEAFGSVKHRGAQTLLMLPASAVPGMAPDDYGRMLAYEHAIDRILTDDVAPVRAALAAQGMPSGKISQGDGFYIDLSSACAKAPGPAVMSKPLNWQPSKGYVFIVTYGRSGSTLLQTVLQSIDGYFIRGENENALFSVYEAWARARMMRQRFDTRRAVPPHGPWYGADEVDADAFAARMIDAFMAEIVRPPEDARVVGFKEIRYGDLSAEDLSGFLAFMQRFFPRAKFVFNTRHWEDVAKSSWWQDAGEGFVEGLVTRSDMVFERFCRDYPGQSYLMRYEDYADNTTQFEKLFEFLDEPLDMAAINELAAQRLEH
ncbi:glycosyltransferase [Kordiimonas aestuarii]|uniref:glycosyltransferase n=1 Tax=Kordiimonas aestuarii TaxID=1005925 RepID=UPI0021D1A2DB|nr:glycosyltransferase [Kordiimonas aestuarii]